MVKLGSIYEEGKGVQQDLLEAYKLYYSACCLHGDIQPIDERTIKLAQDYPISYSGARIRLSRIEKLLSHEQIKLAKTQSISLDEARNKATQARIRESFDRIAHPFKNENP